MRENLNKTVKTTLSVLINGEKIVESYLEPLDVFLQVIEGINVSKDKLCKDFPGFFTKTKKGKKWEYNTQINIGIKQMKVLLEEIFKLYKIDGDVSIDKFEIIEDTRRYWVYTPGKYSMMWEEFYEQGIIGLNHNEDEILVDDVIIVNNGNLILGYGDVVSEYYYDDSRDSYKCCYKVKWNKKGIWDSKKELPSVLTDITSNGRRYYQIMIDIMNTESNVKVSNRNVFGGEVNSSALCITGDSGVGKSYRVEKTLISAKHEYIFENYDVASTGLLTTFNNGKYEVNNIGKFILDAAKNLDKNYTIVLDEVQKEDFLGRINNELFHCLSTKRNDGLRYIQTNSVTDKIFNNLEKRNGRRVITDNVGFILITSKPDVVHNDDIKNRLDIIHLYEDTKKLKQDINTLISLIDINDSSEYSNL